MEEDLFLSADLNEDEDDFLEEDLDNYVSIDESQLILKR